MEIEDIKRLQSATPTKPKPTNKPKLSRWSVIWTRVVNLLNKNRT